MSPRVLSLHACSLAFAALLQINVAANAQESAEDASNAYGERLFNAHCAACHVAGVNGAPVVSALRKLAAPAILNSLESGVMRAQGSALAGPERALIANWLGAQADRAAIEQASRQRCAGALNLDGEPSWNYWGADLANRRYQPPPRAGLTRGQVVSLELKWAFAFPGAARARSQPAVTRAAIFTGSQSGRVYALGVETGCVWWTFDATSEVRSAPVLGAAEDGRIQRLYFGDFNANVYAVDARTGALAWKTRVQDHPAGTITGSPTLHNGRLYVPMSSTEVVSAYNPKYECCTFRGGVIALDAADGKVLWRMHTVPEPRPTGLNREGVRAWGPSGAPIWSTPTIDARRGLLYVGTGENYSSPATDMSDAIIALDLDDGAVRWVQQTTPGDAWNASCGPRNNNVNCPREDGPDFDFGAPPILIDGAGRDLILAGQKSGMVFALDPDAEGRIVWRQRAGRGGFNGGVHWGMASDGATLYVGIADTEGHAQPTGPPRPGLHAFDVASGRALWSRIEPPTCAETGFACQTALSAPVTAMDGVVFGGAHNGLLRAYSAHDGSVLWSFDTRRSFETVNGVQGVGGTIDSAGPVIADGRVIVNSGYDKFGEIPGNVLLVFAPRQTSP